jgi:hypothetical protein
MIPTIESSDNVASIGGITIAPVCPTRPNDGVGHDNNFPLCILMPIMNRVSNMADKGDYEGRKGCAEIYPWEVPIEWSMMI